MARFHGFGRFVGRSDKYDEFALSGPAFEVCCNLGGGAAEPFLEFLGEFAAGDHLTLWAGSSNVLEQARHAVRGLVNAERPGKREEFGEAAGALAGFHGEESGEVEFVGGKSRGGEACHQGARARDGFNAEPGGDDLGDDAGSGVGDAGGAGVGDERDDGAGAEAVGDLGGTAGFVEPEVRDHGLPDVEVLEELAGVAGVLGGDEVTVPEDAEGTQRDVLEVPDGGGDEVERAGDERWRSGGFHAETVDREDEESEFWILRGLAGAKASRRIGACRLSFGIRMVG